MIYSGILWKKTGWEFASARSVGLSFTIRVLTVDNETSQFNSTSNFALLSSVS